MGPTNLYWRSRIEAALKSKSESNEIDFKLDLSEDNERLKEHINAFGNLASGGLFVFGVRRNFTLSPESCDHEKVIQRITSLARDTQKPALQTQVHHFEFSGKPILGMEICSSSQRPVFVKGRDPWTDGAFIRTGNSTRAMTEQEIRDSLSTSQLVQHDFGPVEGEISDLEVDQLGEYFPTFRTNRGLSKQNLGVLADNQIVILKGSEYFPTLGGWLMFANNPQKIRALKNASIEFQQFSGRTRENPVRKIEVVGTLTNQVSLATSYALENIWKMPRIRGIRREDVLSYDQTTLREVITNAVVHRDYRLLHQPVKIAVFSDRIEVENPGGLMPGLTPLNLLNKRAWRNEIIANLMAKVGLGEMDGQGIDRIYGAIRRLKIPAPVIQADQRTFKMILSAPKTYDTYTSQEKRLTVLVLLMLEHEVDNEGIRNIFGIDMVRASNLLKEMVQEKIIARKTKSMKFAKYGLTEDLRIQIGI